jgi:hypothetical protein
MSPESAKTPGWKALYIARSRWTRWIRCFCSSVRAPRSRILKAAAMTLTVVQAMPLAAKRRLYGALSPVSFSIHRRPQVLAQRLAGPGVLRM